MRRQMENDDVVILNVGGARHETRIATLLTKPETRLYSVGQKAKTTGIKEFYFDRNPQMFPFILNYYRIGKLHMPKDMCGPIAKAELDYWELEDTDIEECCWVDYIGYEETIAMLEKFKASERDSDTYYVCSEAEASFFAKIRPRLWRALQDPYSSKAALIFAVISLIIVLTSITVFVLETLPYFGSIFAVSSESSKNITSEEIRHELDIFTEISSHNIILLIDNACSAYFFIELIIKMFASPDKKTFFKSPLVIIEILCLVPFYIGILIIEAHPEPSDVFFLIRVLFATRGLRIFRIFVLIKHFLALKILFYTIRASTKELFLLLVVLLMGVVIFACIIYYLEELSGVDDPEITNIPLAFWWAVITMTTVGYGDFVPKSILGYIFGSLCAISGVLVLALAVPVIVRNFTIYYTHAQSREKLKLREKIFEQTEKCQRLKAEPTSQLKTVALNGVSNAMKKIEETSLNESDPGPKMSMLKVGRRIKTNLSNSSKNSVSDIYIKDPSSARDVILQDITLHVTGASSTRKKETTSTETRRLGNGFAHHQDVGKTILPSRGKIQRTLVRSMFFKGQNAFPKVVKRVRPDKRKQDKDLNKKMFHSRTLGTEMTCNKKVIKIVKNNGRVLHV